MSERVKEVTDNSFETEVLHPTSGAGRFFGPSGVVRAACWRL